MSKWQPIDTAPKDGTHVLLWIKYGDFPVVGYWFTHQGTDLGWQMEKEHFEVSCATYCYGGSVCNAYRTTPTHWMPLPDPPE